MPAKPSFIRVVHSHLRALVKIHGDHKAEKLLREYRSDAQKLKEYVSELNDREKNNWGNHEDCINHFDWTHNSLKEYFHGGLMEKRLEREKRKWEHYNIPIDNEKFELSKPDPIRVLDVGSGCNPFARYDGLNITAIDLGPGHPSVSKCDFLTVKTVKANGNLNPEDLDDFNEIKTFEEESFDAVIFCYFLTFLPSARIRLECCRKAYSLLKPNGVLCIVTPLSPDKTYNYLYEIWRYVLLQVGFERAICQHTKVYHGSLFRKTLNGSLYAEEGMSVMYEELKSKEKKYYVNGYSLEQLSRGIHVIQDY